MRWAVAAVALLFFPGCFGSGAPAAPESTSSSSVPSGLLNHTAIHNVTPPTSSTFHLLAAPLLNMTAPDANATMVATPLAPLSPGQGLVYNRTLRANGTILATSAVIWLRVTQTSVQGGGGDPGCTVVLTLTLRHNGTDAAYAAGCGSAGIGALAPGDHRIEFSSAPGAFPLDFNVTRGDELFFTLTFYAEATGFGSTVFLLCGNAERDSSVRVLDLHEPQDLPRSPRP
jgi:hypothetical protein